MANSYDIGDLVRCTATFTDSAGDAIDPTAIVFRIKLPDDTTTVYTYGTDAELVKSATGVYYVDYTTVAAGTLDYRFEGTGAAVAAAESLFGVKTSTVL